MQLSFYTTMLLFWCGIYPGSIWEWKFLNYRETVQRLFRIEEQNFKTSSQTICRYCLQLYAKYAGDSVQVFVIEWYPSCHVCWKKRYKFCENGLKISLHVSIILIFVSFCKYIFCTFFIIKHESTGHRSETLLLQIVQDLFDAGKQKEILLIIKRASKFGTVANWHKKCSKLCT